MPPPEYKIFNGYWVYSCEWIFRQFLFNVLQTITEQQKKENKAKMEQQMNMFEIKMKALELSLREELRADTEDRMRTEVSGVFKKMDRALEKMREEIKKEVKEEVIPQCAVVKEMRGESIYYYSLLVSSNTPQALG